MQDLKAANPDVFDLDSAAGRPPGSRLLAPSDRRAHGICWCFAAEL